MKNRPVFFSGTSKRMIPNCPAYGCILSATEDLTTVDTVDGAQMILENGDFIFILIPQHDSIRHLTHTNKTLAALHATHKAKTSPKTRGKT